MKITHSQKIKELRSDLKLTQGEFAEVLEVSKSLINSIESGERNISTKLNKIIKEKYHRDLLEEISKAKYADVKLPDGIIALPFYEIGAAAGKGTKLNDEPENKVMYFDKNFIKNITNSNIKNLHLIYAKGDSMDSGWNQPNDIHDGDLLLIDTSICTGNKKVFVIVQDNTLRVKQISFQDDNLVISSFNRKYNDEKHSLNNFDSEIKIVGQVIWNGSKGDV